MCPVRDYRTEWFICMVDIFGLLLHVFFITQTSGCKKNIHVNCHSNVVFICCSNECTDRVGWSMVEWGGGGWRGMHKLVVKILGQLYR